MDDWHLPREIIRTGNFPYKFKLDENFTYESGWVLNKPYNSKWLEITTSGLITVKSNESGYSWDGCTPKWSVLNIFIIGTPDGHIDHRTMKPYTYYASLIHDVLYQYLDTVPVSKEKIDLLFLDMLGDFKLRKTYHFMVKHFGGKGIVQKGIKQSLK